MSPNYAKFLAFGYKIKDAQIIFERTGSHSDLFSK